MIKVNDLDIDFEGSIYELIEKLNLNPEVCVVLVNGSIVKRECWKDFYLKENDCVEIVSFVGGG